MRRTAAVLAVAAVMVAAAPTAHAGTTSHGQLESLSYGGGAFHLSGWTVNAATPTAATFFRVTLDGRTVVAGATPIYRADVNRQQKTNGRHGFAAAVPFQAGEHVLCVDAVAFMAPATNLGCYDLEVDPT